MKRLTVVVLAATALLVEAVPVEAAPVTARTEIAAYIRQMAPLHAKILKAHDRLAAAQLAYVRGSGTWAEARAESRAFTSDVRDAYLGIKGVKPPAELRGPHAGFVLTVKKEFTTMADSPAPQMETLRAHWRQEVTFHLRHTGLSVPLWVKTVRWNW